MKAPAFWSAPPGAMALALSPLGWIYGAVTARRMAQPGAAAGAPVVCVGNLTAGGAGKTPTARWIANWARRQGWAPAILSRGYGGRLTGPVMVDPALHGAADCGDEPLLLARDAPVAVARDRVGGAALAVAQGRNLLIMDDGLQNPDLRKDLVIAVVDGGFGIGNGFCIPAGPLRAPVLRQVPHVDLALIIGDGTAGDAVADAFRAAGKPVIRGRLAPDAASVEALRGKPLLAFAGIGRPSKFFETLRGAGLDLRREQAFADHHAYTDKDLDALRRAAEIDGLTLVTTEKDAMRWPGESAVLPVALELEPAGEAQLDALLTARTRLAI